MKAKGRNIFVIIFITILFIITYLLSSFLFFAVFEEKESERYQQFVSTFHNYLSSFYEGYSPDSLMAAYSDIFYNLGYPTYPSLAALYDENGEFVSQMGIFISCPESMDSSDQNPVYTKKVFLDEYLSPEAN